MNKLHLVYCKLFFHLQTLKFEFCYVFQQDGRLQVSDQLLIINQQSLTNMSNNEALVVLKKALSEAIPGEDSSIQLVSTY